MRIVHGFLNFTSDRNSPFSLNNRRQHSDASRLSVDRALAAGDRIGLAPGGISEMFEGYPKPGTHRDEEYAIG